MEPEITSTVDVELERRGGSSTAEEPDLTGIVEAKTEGEEILYTILSYNINGFREKKEYLNDIRYFEKHKPTVICFQEHRVLSNEKDKLSGLNKYKPADDYCRDEKINETASGGTCIQVRSELWGEVESLKSNFCDGYDRLFEVSAVKIKQNLVVISIYNTVRHLNVFIQNMEQLFNKLQSIVRNESVVIAGDFNFNTMSTVNAMKRTRELANKFDYDLHITEPTTKKGSSIDNVITNFVPKKCEVLKDIEISDHYPIILCRSAVEPIENADTDPETVEQHKRMRSAIYEFERNTRVKELYYEYNEFHTEYRKSQRGNQEAIDGMNRTHRELQILRDQLLRAKGVLVKHLPEAKSPWIAKASVNHDHKLMKDIIKYCCPPRKVKIWKLFRVDYNVARAPSSWKYIKKNPRPLKVYLSSSAQANMLLSKYNPQLLTPDLLSVTIHSNIA